MALKNKDDFSIIKIRTSGTKKSVGRPKKFTKTDFDDCDCHHIHFEDVATTKKRGRPSKSQDLSNEDGAESVKLDKKPVYIRCPRCELNYCLKKDKYCSVCKAEMAGEKDMYADDLELELCPICKTNYIQPDEIMCASCLKERQNNEDIINDDDEWDAYANREDNDDYISDEEETGDMASISDIDDDVLSSDLVDDDIGFDLDIDAGGLDDDEDDLDEDIEEDIDEDVDDFEKVDIDDMEDFDNDISSKRKKKYEEDDFEFDDY